MLLINVNVIKNHFNYIHGRRTEFKEAVDKDSTVNMVDKALKDGNICMAESYLEIEAGHGKIKDNSGRWMIDCCTSPWKEGTTLLSDNDGFHIEGDSIETCFVIWKDERWNVFECSLNSVDELRKCLYCFKIIDPIRCKL